MARIIIDNIREQSLKVKLYAFVDGMKVGPVNQYTSLEFDLDPGDHLLHVGFSARRPGGVGVPFSVTETETKTIQVNLTDWALLAARWHVFMRDIGLLALAYVVFDFLLGFIGYELKHRDAYFTLAAILFPLGAVVYPLVALWHRIKPKNFIKIEVLE